MTSVKSQVTRWDFYGEDERPLGFILQGSHGYYEVFEFVERIVETGDAESGPNCTTIVEPQFVGSGQGEIEFAMETFEMCLPEAP